MFSETRTKMSVEVYVGKNLDSLPPPSQTVTDIAMKTSETVPNLPAKPKSTAELVRNTSELKVPVIRPSFALTVTYYN